jgi:probable DNA repair protein
VQAEIDSWLNSGGLVVTASDRAARALSTAFHRARRAQGLSAWPAPNILDWKSFLRAAWEERALDGRMLLNSTQEAALWTGIVGESRQPAALLEGPRHRLAGLAVEAQELLSAYAPHFLRTPTRAAWQQDAASFSAWLTAFDDLCRSGKLLSQSRLPLELIPLLQAESAPRPPLLLAGFDRILPVQRTLFDAWGPWRQTPPGQPAAKVHFYEAGDAQAELAACAMECSRQLAANPYARLLVVTQNASARRGQIERAFLRFTGSASAPLFEFSLGVPLSQIALAGSAHLLLRWLTGAVEERELDWLLSTGHAAASPEESLALQAAMRLLRRRGLERTQWTLAAFIRQQPVARPLPSLWIERMTQAQSLLETFANRPQSPLDWTGLVPRLLQAAGWPGGTPLSSAQHQAETRWQLAVESCGSLGFDGRRIRWHQFLATLGRILDETLFAPESRDAPIQIAGPAESAGLAADAVWFLGADEAAWPAAGATNPLLPPEVQRDSAMPHATAQLDWELARAITARLLTAAPQVHFSYARQNEASESRPSGLVVQLAGSPQPLPSELIAPPCPPPLTQLIQDASRIPFAPGKVQGGAGVLTAQSQCPFKAFATARLAARGWEPAQPGLNASQRGQLLHAVLRSIWSGPPDGIRSHHELVKLQDPAAFVAGHVQRVLRKEIPAGIRERMPRRYLELEELRLTRLLTEWLSYEATRIAFDLVDTEVARTVLIAGLAFDLRLDRLDRLSDGSLLVIDYKSGDVSPKSWDLPRPNDVQLPLYAGFALAPKDELGGLVFAKVRAGEQNFAGRLSNVATTVFADIKGNNALVKNPLTASQLNDWKNCIEQLAGDFLAGRAEVDPREYPQTCEHCGLQSLCRVLEHQDPLEAEDGSEEEEAADE